MKKFFAVLILVFFSSNLVADNEVSIMADPQNCLGCHDDIHADWTTSLHAKSHEDSSELYKKVVELVASETKHVYEQVLVSCGTCHNPRLETKSISDDVALASCCEPLPENLQIFYSDEQKMSEIAASGGNIIDLHSIIK